MKTTCIFLFSLLSFFITLSEAQGRDLDESQLMLQEAMMNSNADYNKHKKKMNHEEFDRADDWSDRDSQAIVIEGQLSPLVDFQEVRLEVRQDREVSSHQTDADLKEAKD